MGLNERTSQLSHVVSRRSLNDGLSLLTLSKFGNIHWPISKMPKDCHLLFPTYTEAMKGNSHGTTPYTYRSCYVSPSNALTCTTVHSSAILFTRMLVLINFATDKSFALLIYARGNCRGIQQCTQSWEPELRHP
jgi:hypothetical protein